MMNLHLVHFPSTYTSLCRRKQIHSRFNPHCTSMSTHLLLFLLFLSLFPHAFIARHHGLFRKTSRKSAEKVMFSKTKLKPLFHEQDHQQKPKDHLDPIPRIMVETKGMAQGVVRIKSLVTVSWKIPHQKHAKDPRFDLDYAPPKTHPPSNN